MALTFDSLRQHARGIVGGGVLVGVAGLVLSQTLFAPDYEVSYGGGISTAFCLPAERGGSCSFVYTLSLGNTGRRTQEAVRIAWLPDMRGWSFDAQASDIVASAQPTPRPRVMPRFDSDGTTCEIAGLAPNTLVDIRIRCLACSTAQMEEMRAARPMVEARGTVSESDPRVSTLRRSAINFLRVLGQFG